jgi:hypothetical protein
MFMIALFGGMVVLSAWAITNIILGVLKRKTSIGSTKYYWEMNALWNSINFTIALIASAIAGLKYDTYTTDTALQSLQIKIVAVNILLDIAYITIGLWLEARGKKQQNHRFIGYGNSIQLQGAFLFFFDSALALALIIATL